MENVIVKSAQDCGPVTVSISRRVRPGKDSAYEEWVKGITKEALTFAGHMGVNVLRPAPGSRDYVTIFRFDNYQHLQAWEESDIRGQWLSKLEDIVEDEQIVEKGTGLEFWFNLPELPVKHPQPHKMVVVLFVVVFTMISILNFVLAPVIKDWPQSFRLLLVVAIQVVLMTYVIMPQITRLLKGWLFR